MKFRPYYDKIEIQPIEKKTAFADAGDKKFYELGIVVAVGRDVTFLKEGDLVSFDSYGCAKTPKDDDGIEHYIVKVSDETIYGVLEKE